MIDILQIRQTTNRYGWICPKCNSWNELDPYGAEIGKVKDIICEHCKHNNKGKIGRIKNLPEANKPKTKITKGKKKTTKTTKPTTKKKLKKKGAK